MSNKFLVKATRAVLNVALAVHRKAILSTVDAAYFKASTAARYVADQKKFVQLAKEREIILLDDYRAADKSAKTIEAVAKAELARLPSKLA